MFTPNGAPDAFVHQQALWLQVLSYNEFHKMTDAQFVQIVSEFGERQGIDPRGITNDRAGYVRLAYRLVAASFDGVWPGGSN